MLDLTPLRHFKALVEAGTFSKAAKKLYVTQPAVSHQVKELERQLGVTLLIRGRGGVVLTPPGQFLYGFCQELFLKLEDAEKQVQELKTAVQGTIRVGAPAGIFDGWLVAILARFFASFPGVSSRQVVGSHETLRQLLLARKLDLALLLEEAAPDQELLEYVPVYEEEYILLAEGQALDPDPASLLDLPFIAFQEADHMLHHWLDVRVKGARHRLTIKHVVNHIPGIKALVQAGQGVAVLPRHAVAQELRRGDLREIMGQGPDRRVTNMFFLAYHRHGYLGPALRELLDRICQHARV